MNSCFLPLMILSTGTSISLENTRNSTASTQKSWWKCSADGFTSRLSPIVSHLGTEFYGSGGQNDQELSCTQDRGNETNIRKANFISEDVSDLQAVGLVCFLVFEYIVAYVVFRIIFEK
jgi:hypothetical protein